MLSFVAEHTGFVRINLLTDDRLLLLQVPPEHQITETVVVVLNKYEAIIIAKLVSERLRESEETPGSLEYGMLLELEQNLSTFLLEEAEAKILRGAGG
jgi:hypothetical protein